MSDYSFNKETILSRPIKDENDLADVIVEMRKAIGFLLDEVVDLRRTMASQENELQFHRGQQAAQEQAETYTRATWPTSTWPGIVTDSEVSERIDRMVSQPIMKGRLE